jgi:hypothetical protein
MPRQVTQNENVSPSAILVNGIRRNAVGSVPASTLDRVPPSRVFFVTEHDDMKRYDSQSLARFFLNLPDTTLINRDGGKAFFPRYILTVPAKVVSAGVDCDVLESNKPPRARYQLTPTHWGNRFVARDTEDDPQVIISDGLKPLGPTEMLDDKSPRRADRRVIFEWLTAI